MSYIVKASHYQSEEKILFEGPLDLLLDLIEKEKLEITDISIARVTDQFLRYLERNKNIGPQRLADFLLVAGKLILIKSKAILPLLELKEEEEMDIEKLKWQLREYQKFKEISREIKKIENRKKMFFSRGSYMGIKTVFCPPENLSSQDLTNIFENILDKLPKFEKLTQETIKKVISIRDKIEHLKQSLAYRIEMTFHEATSGFVNKVEVIVTFLAMLELVRKKVVVIEQTEMFGEIRIRKNKN